MELSILAVGLGFLLDLLLGDPHWLYHPIRLVGHLITGLETVLRRIFPLPALRSLSPEICGAALSPAR